MTQSEGLRMTKVKGRNDKRRTQNDNFERFIYKNRSILYLFDLRQQAADDIGQCNDANKPLFIHHGYLFDPPEYHH